MSKKTVSVKLHHYATTASHPDYKKVLADIKANDVLGRGHPMHAISLDKDRNNRQRPHGTVETVEIELQHLFGNQCNTTDGRRIFDWWENTVYIGGSRGESRVGHWIEITEELAQARRDAHRCGHCGHTYGPNHTEPIPMDGFCSRCLESPYLKPDNFPLLRLVPVIEPEPRRMPLTEDETAALMPRYLEAQTRGDADRAAARRKRERQQIEEDRKRIYEKIIPAAEVEYKGKLWLWEHEISLDNVIYYNHTGRFCFGWRAKLSPEVTSKLLDVPCEFPFNYDTKTSDKQRSLTMETLTLQEKIKRLKIWEKAVRKLPKPVKKFNMTIFCETNKTFTCCTAACALGTAAYVPSFQKLGLIPDPDGNSVQFIKDKDFVKEYNKLKTEQARVKYLNKEFSYYGIESLQDFEACEKFFGLSKDETRRICDPDSYRNPINNDTYFDTIQQQKRIPQAEVADRIQNIRIQLEKRYARSKKQRSDKS